MKLLSQLRQQFTHLKEHKFRHGFNGTINPLCPCGTDVETTGYFLLRCHCFSTQRSELFDYLYRLDPSFSKLNTEEKVAYLLYGLRSNSSDLNKEVIKLVIKFLKSTGRSNEPLIFFDKGNVKFPTAFTTEAAIKRCSGKWMFLEFYKVIKITQGIGMPVGDCFVVWLQASSRWLC